MYCHQRSQYIMPNSKKNSFCGDIVHPFWCIDVLIGSSIYNQCGEVGPHHLLVVVRNVVFRKKLWQKNKITVGCVQKANVNLRYMRQPTLIFENYDAKQNSDRPHCEAPSSGKVSLQCSLGEVWWLNNVETWVVTAIYPLANDSDSWQ